MNQIIKKHVFNQKGETIVEVLIAIALLGFALGSGFAIANKSKNTMQASQERYQAQLVANGQADSLKKYLSDPAKRATMDTRPVNYLFCLYSASGSLALEPISGALPSNCRTGLNNLYEVRVTKKSMSAPNPDTYFIQVKWDSLINTTNQDKVELLYGL